MEVSAGSGSGPVEFLDLGCSSGGSLEFGKIWWEVDGVGIDLDPRKVAAAVAQGHRAIVGDVTALDDSGEWLVVQGIHFLEHLPSAAFAQEAIRRAARVSTDLVYFRQPYFDADSALADLGLKLYWSDWTGHPNRMTVPDYCDALIDLVASGGLGQFVVWGIGSVSDANDRALLPISAPPDQLEFDADLQGPKPTDAPLGFPVFRETLVLGMHSVSSPRATKVASKMRGMPILASSMTDAVLARWLASAAQDHAR